MRREFTDRLPKALLPLKVLATDLRWTWSHAGDQLWRKIDEDIWQHTRNPYAIMQATTEERFRELAGDPEFLQQLHLIVADRDSYQSRDSWYQQTHPASALKTVAYFSMEYGLGEALPFYAGGLGILAGDFLKAASDLGVPLVAVGLLFHQGYFRQMLDSSGWQLEVFPSCDTESLPIAPVISETGDWLKVALDLPGRRVWLRVWQVEVGRVRLYLLDSNHQLNNPFDRGITNQLYPSGKEHRFVQQLALGIGGWSALQALSLDVDICHLNESHCAFVVLERALCYMRQHDVNLEMALLATRSGNVFTTHTPLPAANDTFDLAFAEKYLCVYAKAMDISVDALMAPGIHQPENDESRFVPMQLAVNGSIAINAVSRIHQQVTRRMFRPQFPRWPEHEIPLSYITNGVHVPSWDSAWADKLWTDAAGKERWMGNLANLPQSIRAQTDQQLWDCKCHERTDLIHYVRHRYAADVSQRGGSEAQVKKASCILDPNILTLGFARRFTDYKRPNLLLRDPDRLHRLLTGKDRPMQLVIAGKAHPADTKGKHFIQQWIDFIDSNGLGQHVVFLSDYDIALAQEMVQGIDVWINTPRYSWEACGTSGMKVLANGGINLSELDGWWAEAYQPSLGWAIGDGREHSDEHWDEEEATQLYAHIENAIAHEFYARDHQGLPRQWIARMRNSMADLAPLYSSNRMIRDYTDLLYLPAAQLHHDRQDAGGKRLTELYKWQCTLHGHWHEVHWGELELCRDDNGLHIDVQVYLGSIPHDWVKVQLYADLIGGGGKNTEAIEHDEIVCFKKFSDIAGSVGGYHFHGTLRTQRPLSDYSLRIFGWHELASVPLECKEIQWRALVE